MYKLYINTIDGIKHRGTFQTMQEAINSAFSFTCEWFVTGK